MSQEEKLKLCIKILQNESSYTTRILAELLSLDLIHNDGIITRGLELDVDVLMSALKKTL